MQYITNASIYLVDVLVGLALYIVLLRFWMQWVRANFRNELGQFVISISNPIVMPLRKVVPSIKTIDTATLLLAYLIALLKFVTIEVLDKGTPIPLQFPGALLAAAGVLLQASIYLFMAAIFIVIIASFLAPHSYHPILMVARSISEPLMSPARRIIPPISGIDLSPILVFLFLNLCLILVAGPLIAFG